MRTRIIILLLLLGFQSAGFLLIFKVQQLLIRREMKAQIKAGIPDDQLVLLRFPKTGEADFSRPHWLIGEKEFRYQGKMYDVVRRLESGDTTFYYCIPDEKESRLFANLDEQVRNSMNQDPQRKKQNESLQRSFSQYLCTGYQDFPLLKREKEIEFSAYLFRLKTWIDPPSTPPPKAFTLI